jgi:invasion protein IalB
VPKTTRPTLILAWIFVIFSLAAAAQTAKQTSATYEDWTLSCVYAAEPRPKSCQASQAQTRQGQTAQLTRIAIVPAFDGHLVKVYFQVPPNVRIASGVRLFGSGEESLVVATFIWCVATRCVAENDVSAELLGKLAKTSEARIVFKDANEHEVAVPVSTKGLSQTLNAMNEALMQGKEK